MSGIPPGGSDLPPRAYAILEAPSGFLFIDGNADYFQPEAEPNGEGASMPAVDSLYRASP